MAKPKTDLKALRNLISEAELILSTTVLPEGRSQRARELLKAAVSLADQLVSIPPAAIVGKLGGLKTAKLMVAKEPDYYKRIASQRENRRGGRPKKDDR